MKHLLLISLIFVCVSAQAQVARIIKQGDIVRDSIVCGVVADVDTVDTITKLIGGTARTVTKEKPARGWLQTGLPRWRVDTSRIYAISYGSAPRPTSIKIVAWTSDGTMDSVIVKFRTMGGGNDLNKDTTKWFEYPIYQPFISTDPDSCYGVINKLPYGNGTQRYGAFVILDSQPLTEFMIIRRTPLVTVTKKLYFEISTRFN